MAKTGAVARAAAMLGIPLMIAVLSACGSDAPDKGDPSAAPSFASFEEYQLAFAECMRGKGIEMDDPDADGTEITAADDGFMEAAEGCQDDLGAPPAAEGGQGPSDEELRAEHLEIAECMREHGVDVADPGPGENLDVPADVPVDVMETCAPEGVFGSTGSGQ